MGLKSAVRKCGRILLPLTELQAGAARQKLDLSPEEAAALLHAARPDRPCEIEGHHILAPAHDLQIVLPAYNAAPYLRACLDSVLQQQTAYTFEITAVDDGSTDGTGEILDAYAAGDSRLRVLHQANGGIARARNAGMQTLTGRYIMFVDADDLLEPGAIQALLQKAFGLDADVVEGGHTVFADGGRARSTVRYRETEQPGLSQHRGQPWGRVIRAACFEHLQFPPGFEYEDSIIGCCLLPAAAAKYNIAAPVYRWRYHAGGITQTAKQSEKCLDTFYISLVLWDWYAAHFPLTEDFYRMILRQLVLNQSRTAGMGETLQNSGFCLEREYCLQRFPQPPALQGRYRLLDQAVRAGDRGNFRLVCSRWKWME